jgi:hypothetical protein
MDFQIFRCFCSFFHFMIDVCLTSVQLASSYPMVAKSLREIRKGVHQHRHHCCGLTLKEHGLGYEDLDVLLQKPQPLEFIFGNLD